MDSNGRGSGGLLVITDGSLAAAVASRLASESFPGAPLYHWHAPNSGLLPEDESACPLTVERLAGASGAELLQNRARFETRAAALLAAATEAHQRGCRAVVWPIRHGDDLRAVDHDRERADAAARLIELEGGQSGGEDGGFEILTPIIDLTEHWLRDLAEDVGALRGRGWGGGAEAA